MDLEGSVKLVSQFREAIADDPVIAILLFMVLLFLILNTFIEFCKLLARAVSALKNGLKTSIEAIRGGAQYREHIQRRRQFLSVLSSDLAAIGKAEAWNDQNFTDLEAEVQVDGGYFASVFDRLRNHRSFGQRREKSLIGAIDGSAERCLLLTGDPGAGKSVALRHLAMQMIDRARTSKTKYAAIPLYVNLRELSVEGEIGSAQIKNFVIDNVRRGDADTAEYLNRNWADFNQKGGWFFLFDSFDEIPQVLHAANEDVKIERYGKAIQQFMDGLGGCRGVLASREFKSPKALAWPRLKILPLNEPLQEELVDNTFLTKAQKQVALRALSTSRSATYRNPLFLTLLCRYVREKEVSPKNEHELLYQHVNSLCERDEEYVGSRWGLNREAMKLGAAELSKIFALAPEVGLAPSVEEISGLAANSEFLRDKVERVVEALTYVKVGRMDVATASKRERRFAFSHRRYQEAIFAKYLSENHGFIEPAELLCNPRWREYVVAMLQTTSLDKGHALVEHATKLIRARCSTGRVSEGKDRAGAVRAFPWTDEVLTHLLKLMVDVKTFNPSPAWAESELDVERFFAPLWVHGDLFDRAMIIRHGGAGSAIAHSRRLEYARESGITSLQEEAVSSCQFATTPSVEVANWIRERVARKIVLSSKNMDALKWESLAAQLPSAYEATFCVTRAKALRNQHRYARLLILPLYYLERLRRSSVGGRSSESVTYRKFRFAMLFVNMVPIFVIAGAGFPTGKIDAPETVKAALVGLMLVCLLSLAITHVRLENLSLPRRLRLWDAIRSFTVDYKLFLTASFASVIASIVAIMPGLALVWASRHWSFLSSWKDPELILMGSTLLWAGVVAGILLFSRRSEARGRLEAIRTLATRKSLRSAVAEAVDTGHVAEVCRVAINDPATSNADVRRTITLISGWVIPRRGGERKVELGDRAGAVEGSSILLAEYLRRHAAAPL